MNMNQQSYFPSFPACGKSNPSINNRKRKVEQDDDLSMQNSSSSQPMSFDGFNAPSNKVSRSIQHLTSHSTYATHTLTSSPLSWLFTDLPFFFAITSVRKPEWFH